MDHSLTQPTRNTTSQTSIGVAWMLIVLTSLLPAVLFTELTGESPAWLLWVQLAALALLAGLSITWPAARALRPLTLVLTTILAGSWAIQALGISERVSDLLATLSPFTASMLGEQTGRTILTTAVIAVLWLLYRDRHLFFLTAGDLRATAAPIRWIGHTEPAPWSRLGPIAGILISLGTLAFVWFAGRPTTSQVAATLPLLPAVLVVAALNAFNETMTYRASLLATLEKPVGAAQATLMAAVWFGIGHYYGVPYGVVGAVMATFLGWFLARSVLETRGIFWAWAIHFLQDAVIFFFLAMGSVVAGGA